MSSWSLVVCASLVLSLLAGCRAQSELTATGNTPAETIVSSTPPFQTKEPERYRATRIVTITTAAGETLVTKTSIARDGERRRNESAGTVYLELPEGKFVLLPDEKVYADVVAEPEPNTEEQVSPESLLHADTGTTSYQNLGAEIADGRNTNKYRVVVNSSNPQNVSLSETLIWIDETLKMPVKSETTSRDGTRIRTELSELKLDVEGGIFQIPADFEKITFAELRQRRIRTE
jgi:outer membrane lipoprotein-sorting protein